MREEYSDRAASLETDDDGLEVFVWDGKRSKLSPPGFAGILGAMGHPDILPGPERTYEACAPRGSMEPKGRLALLDEEGLAKAVLYPTLGAVADGCKGAMFPPYTMTRKAHGHPYYDKLWAKAQELDV
ncbi:MAG: hypothetical protein HKP27_03740, partial [Myxococcales bacterium]|nr:hypothetical protein [Myxococcales bacterium]